MMPGDFVFDQIYKGALRDGANERQAHKNAVLGLDDYKRGKMDGDGKKRVADLIKKMIKAAVKESK